MLKKLSWLLILLCGEVGASDLSIEFSAGTANYKRIYRDNYWYQELYPYSHDLTSGAWRLGLNKKLDSRTSVTVAWLNLGRTSVIAQALASDAAYSACLAGDQSFSGCGHTKGTIITKDRTQGPEVSLTREFDSFYVRGGMYLWIHKLDVTWIGATNHTYFNGTLLAPFAGVGVRAGPFFAEVSYYYALGDGGYPIAKQALVPMLGLKWEI